MKLTTLLSLSLLLISSLAFAERKIEHSYNYSALDFSKNKIDSASGFIIPNANYEASFRASETDDYESFAGAGIRIAVASQEKPTDSNVLLGLNVKAGTRARLGENVKLGVGASYTYNIARENFQDVTIFNQLRYQQGKDANQYVQLEVGKSVTDRNGYSIGIAAGKKF